MASAFVMHEEEHHGGADPVQPPLDCLADVAGRYDVLVAAPPDVEQALVDAFHAMDAACRWAAGETAGIRTIADADRHTAGYDALLAATVKAGQAAGLLSKP